VVRFNNALLCTRISVTVFPFTNYFYFFIKKIINWIALPKYTTVNEQQKLSAQLIYILIKIYYLVIIIYYMYSMI